MKWNQKSLLETITIQGPGDGFPPFALGSWPLCRRTQVSVGLKCVLECFLVNEALPNQCF